MERRQRHEKKRMDRLFFKQMEQNIRDNLKNGNVSPGVVLAEEKEEKAQQQQQQQQQPPLPPRARTISGMDEIMLQEALGAPAFKTQQQQQHNSSVMIPRRDAHGRPPLNPARLNTLPSELSLEFSPEQSDRVSQHPLVSREESYASLSSGFQSELDLRGEALLDGPMDEDVYEVADLHKNQQHVRRNTGGTIYAESTMMNPDVQATIKVSCIFDQEIVLSYIFVASQLLNSKLTQYDFLYTTTNTTVRLRCLSSSHYPSLEQAIREITSFDTLPQSKPFSRRTSKNKSSHPGRNYYLLSGFLCSQSDGT